MAIATAGIIDQNWANELRQMIANDHYVDYYIETTNTGGNLPIDPAEAEVIRANARRIDSITGLRLRETQNSNEADIVFTQVDSQFFNNPTDAGTLGYAELLTDEFGSYFDIVYADNEAEFSIYNTPDNITIRHELAHALGLAHPYGDGFNPNFTMDDTLMSYNLPPSGRAGWTDSDDAALKFLWGEAGTNYDASGTSSSTPSNTSSGVTANIDNVIKGTNKNDKLKGTSYTFTRRIRPNVNLQLIGCSSRLLDALWLLVGGKGLGRGQQQRRQWRVDGLQASKSSRRSPRGAIGAF